MANGRNFESEEEVELPAEVAGTDPEETETELEDLEFSDQEGVELNLDSPAPDETESEDVDLLADENAIDYLSEEPELSENSGSELSDSELVDPEILDFFFLPDALAYQSSEEEADPEPESESEPEQEEEDKPELAAVEALRPRCPISYKYLTPENAIGSEYGHAFDEKSINRWVDKKGLCPLTKQYLSRHGLFKPIALNQSMEYSAALENEVKRLSDARTADANEWEQKAAQAAAQAAQELQVARAQIAALRAERDELRLQKRKFNEVYKLVAADEPPARNLRQRTVR